MRHRKKTIKLGRTSAHRKELLANQVCALIKYKRIKTTLQKARATRVLAEKMVTLGKKGTLAARRRAISKLKQVDRVKELFETIAPSFEGRPGGYTRIVKLNHRASDNSEMVYLEWVDASETRIKTEKTDEAPKQKETTPKDEVLKEESKEIAEKPAEEVTKEVVEETAEEATSEVAEETAEEKSEETAEEESEETAEETKETSSE